MANPLFSNLGFEAQIHKKEIYSINTEKASQGFIFGEDLTKKSSSSQKMKEISQLGLEAFKQIVSYETKAQPAFGAGVVISKRGSKDALFGIIAQTLNRNEKEVLKKISKICFSTPGCS